MKKIILSTFAILAFGIANAQFKVGINGGIPVGDIKDYSSLSIGADLAYTWNLSDNFDAGFTTGYITYLGKDNNENINFIPVAATAQLSLSENFFLGADLGYGVPLKKELDGGLLYQPKLGYKVNNVEIYAGYKGISLKDVEVNSFNLGLNYKF